MKHQLPIELIALLMENEEHRERLFPQEVALGTLRPVQEILKWTDAKVLDITGKTTKPLIGSGTTTIDARPKDAGKYYINNGTMVIIDEQGRIWVTKNPDGGLARQLQIGGYDYQSTNVPLSNKEQLVENGKAIDPWGEQQREEQQTKEELPHYKQRAQDIKGRQLIDKYRHEPVGHRKPTTY